MNRRSINLPLWFGLLVSLALHGILIIPAMMRTMIASGEMVSLAATFNPEDIKQPTPDRNELPPELALGIDDGSPSTLTWLGYREPEEQHAQPSEVEQAAFTDDPTATTAPPTDLPPVDVPVDEPSPTQQPGAEQPQESAEQNQSENESQQTPSESPEQPTEQTTPAEQPTEHANEAAAEMSNSEEAPAEPIATSNNISPTEALFQFAEELRKVLAMASSSAPQSKPSEEGASSAQAAAPQTGAAQPSASAQPADPNREKADMDSDPSSKVEVPFDDIKIGKPLAARGLTLRPQKPEFTTLTLMTAAPRNPLVEIDFGPEGKPLEARILQSSRDGRIDNAIEASLYRWRAEGKPLAQLKGEQVISIQIRIILNPRARSE